MLFDPELKALPLSNQQVLKMQSVFLHFRMVLKQTRCEGHVWANISQPQAARTRQSVLNGLEIGSEEIADLIEDVEEIKNMSVKISVMR